MLMSESINYILNVTIRHASVIWPKAFPVDWNKFVLAEWKLKRKIKRVKPKSVQESRK
jgi:hypothetical protein